MPHCYGNSPCGITPCYHPAERRWHFCLYPKQFKLLLDLVTPERCKAEWPSWLGYIQWWYTQPKTVTHPSTNQAQCKVTLFIWRTTLPLHQTVETRLPSCHCCITLATQSCHWRRPRGLPRTTSNYYTTTTILRLSGLCPGQPGWASIRRNIHPLTPIVVINHPLSASSIFYNP